MASKVASTVKRRKRILLIRIDNDRVFLDRPGRSDSGSE
jgi:hypothetical protein